MSDPPSNVPITLTDTNAATLARFVAGTGEELPRFDRAMLTTPGSATYKGFVAIARPYQGFRQVPIGTALVPIRTNYQNGPIGAAQVNITFGEVPIISGQAGNFVAVADADIEIADGESFDARDNIFDPKDFELDPDLDLISIPGELTFSGGNIVTSRTVVDGVPDDSTARDGLSLTVTGTLDVPAGVGGLTEDRRYDIDNMVSLAVTDNSVSGSGTLEVENGLFVTSIDIVGIK